MSAAIMKDAAIADISARLDRLPGTRRLWQWVAKLSLGGFFEVFDLAFTALMSPLLVRAGVFHGDARGIFGLPDQASFAFLTMLGLYVGSLGFSTVADKYSRKSTFLASMLWYAAATVMMGFQDSASGVCLWRFVAGIGLGAELVVVDCYLAEITPKALRGRVFSISKAVQLCAVPVAGIFAHTIGRREWLGVAGWRWMAFLPAVGAVIVMLIRRNIPESPRWLASNGKIDDANAIVSSLENDAVGQGLTLAEPQRMKPVPVQGARYRDLFKPPHFRRVVMLLIAAPASSIAFYGFAHWVPTLLEHQGVTLRKSLLYSAMIGVAYPLSPLLASLFSDRIERKWQIGIAGPLVAVLGILFAQQSRPFMWIAIGILLTICSEISSTATHTYRTELFPTQVRAKAVGLIYSFDRLATAFSSYLIGFILLTAGVPGVFWMLAAAMGLCTMVTLLLGPRTLGRAYEEIEDPGRPSPAVDVRLKLNP
jgi:putative MFS transporter